MHAGVFNQLLIDLTLLMGCGQKCNILENISVQRTVQLQFSVTGVWELSPLIAGSSDFYGCYLNQNQPFLLVLSLCIPPKNGNLMWNITLLTVMTKYNNNTKNLKAASYLVWCILKLLFQFTVWLDVLWREKIEWMIINVLYIILPTLLWRQFFSTAFIHAISFWYFCPSCWQSTKLGHGLFFFSQLC